MIGRLARLACRPHLRVRNRIGNGPAAGGDRVSDDGDPRPGAPRLAPVRFGHRLPPRPSSEGPGRRSFGHGRQGAERRWRPSRGRGAAALPLPSGAGSPAVGCGTEGRNLLGSVPSGASAGSLAARSAGATMPRNAAPWRQGRGPVAAGARPDGARRAIIGKGAVCDRGRRLRAGACPGACRGISATERKERAIGTEASAGCSARSGPAFPLGSGSSPRPADTGIRAAHLLSTSDWRIVFRPEERAAEAGRQGSRSGLRNRSSTMGSPSRTDASRSKPIRAANRAPGVAGCPGAERRDEPCAARERPSPRPQAGADAGERGSTRSAPWTCCPNGPRLEDAMAAAGRCPIRGAGRDGPAAGSGTLCRGTRRSTRLSFLPALARPVPLPGSGLAAGASWPARAAGGRPS